MTGERQWSGKTDGAPWMHRALIGLLKVFPLWAMYLLAVLVVPFYMLFNHKGYLAIYHYLRNRQGWGPLKSFLGCYANHFLFSTSFMDRLFWAALPTTFFSPPPLWIASPPLPARNSR